jgi:hypothetical protein
MLELDSNDDVDDDEYFGDFDSDKYKSFSTWIVDINQYIEIIDDIRFENYLMNRVNIDLNNIFSKSLKIGLNHYLNDLVNDRENRLP